MELAGVVASLVRNAHRAERLGETSCVGEERVLRSDGEEERGKGTRRLLRALEEAAIRTCAAWGIPCHRQKGATGVWTGHEGDAEDATRKIAAIGVRVSRSCTLHGMALNVEPQLGHFGLIVPCGLHGRVVTSMRAEVGDACPSFAEASERLAMETVNALRAASAAAAVTRPSAKAP